MRILVVSDSHGSISALKQALYQASEENKIDMIFHLGDNFKDAVELQKIADIPVECVAGNCDFVNYPTKRLVTAGGKRFFLAHGHEYGVGYSLDRLAYAAMEEEADAALFGHTHKPLLDYGPGFLILNPGSVSRPRASKPSYGVIDIDSNGVLHANLFTLT